VTLAECDRILASKGGNKKAKSSMGDAVQGTEAIRTWKEHMIGQAKLEEQLQTNLKDGLNEGAAKILLKQFDYNALT